MNVEAVARRALLDRILRALSDGPTATSVICARIGKVYCTCKGCRGRWRRAVPDDIEDCLDALSFDGAIRGDLAQVLETGETFVIWTRVLPVGEFVDL